MIAAAALSQSRDKPFSNCSIFEEEDHRIRRVTFRIVNFAKFKTRAADPVFDDLFVLALGGIEVIDLL